MKKVDMNRRKALFAIPILACSVCAMASGCKQQGKASVNILKCKGCMACASACPEGAIKKVAGVVRVDASKCSGCGVCTYECSHGAITV